MVVSSYLGSCDDVLAEVGGTWGGGSRGGGYALGIGRLECFEISSSR